MDGVDELVVTPIGILRSPLRELAEAPRQGVVGRGIEARIELVPGRHLEDAVADLEQWTHLWVIFWFDRAGGYRPKVQPPRSERRRGVLATRSPHRPNPLGLSLARLVRVEGLVIHLSDVDMLDGTPVLDIKPYLPYADVVPDAGSGWLAADPDPGYEVRFTVEAAEQLAFLEARGEALREAVTSRLRLGPQPHAYRRIRAYGDHAELAFKAWRLDFRCVGRTIEVFRVRSGHRPRDLAKADPALQLHRDFVAAFA